MAATLWLAGESALLPSRIQMAFTLATHVLLVPLGVALPSLTLLMEGIGLARKDRKSTRLNSSHRCISYAVFCLKKKKQTKENRKNEDCEQQTANSRLLPSGHEDLKL